jgi:hypothetical protein
MLDRIEWPIMLSILAYGVRIVVRSNDERLANELLLHLPPGSQCVDGPACGRVYSVLVENDGASAERKASLWVDGRALLQGVTIPAALRAFEAAVQIDVAENAPDRVFVHAGVIGWHGRAIVFPGRSFSGKSTLVAALVRAGAEYYSDEYAVLDSKGNVHAYPRRLSIREGRGPAVNRYMVEGLGGRAGTTPLHVGLVVVSNFRPDGKWQPRTLSPGQGALALLANTVPARRAPARVLATLNQVVLRALVLSSERGEASTSVGSILDIATPTWAPSTGAREGA